jgi:hypothetical protein
MNIYTHTFCGQEVQAIAALPDLSLPPQEEQKAKATGTDGQNVFAICLAKDMQNQPFVDPTAKRNRCLFAVTKRTLKI